MKRVPEPELMVGTEQAEVYAGPHLDSAYWLFLQCVRKFFPDLAPEDAILDLGCGPAAIPLRLARLFPNCEIHGVDGAPQMLEHGRQAVQREGLEHQVQLIHGILPQRLLLPRSRYEMIISNSFLHHLVDPMVLWNALHAYGRPNAAILIVDLVRPASEEQARVVVDNYMPDAPLQLREDMMLSLCAGFTLDEVTSQLEEGGLTENLCVKMVSPCQFAVYGKLSGEL